MIESCLDNPGRLSDWENNFIESISEQLDRVGTISEKQLEVLDRIYQKVP